MSNRRIIISRNPLEATAYETHTDVKFVREFLMEQFPDGWPTGAHVYHNVVSQDNDITPHDEDTLEALEALDGDIIVVVYPEGPLLLPFLIVAALVAAVVLLAPKAPEVATPSNRNQQSSSPNNELSSRTNKARIGARVPEIYGTVRSTPDLIMQTYTYYESNRKVEIAYMCIGRGYFAIQDVKDADTHLSYIPGSAAQFYLPYQSPNSGHAPQYSVGSAITDPLQRAFKLEQVVGQEMRPPNSGGATGNATFKFQYPDRIYNSVGFIFNDRFQAGDLLNISGATFSGAQDNVSVTATSRYVYNGGTPYVEWQSGDPSGSFLAGDSLQISNSATTGVLDTFTTNVTRTASFTSTGRIDFDTYGSHPIEDGLDFRTGQSITVTGATFTYDFSGSYNVSSKTTSKLILSNTTSIAPAAWAALTGSSGYQTMTIAGISRSARFNKSDNSIELAAGNFSDITLPGDSPVTISGAGTIFTTNLSGTYTLASVNNGGNYWTLTSPSSVNAEWNEINTQTADVSITISQTHAGDTESTDFNGTYTVASVTTSRIYLTSPGSVNANWNDLSGYVNDRVEYGGTTDTFFVSAPIRSVNLNGNYTAVSVGTYEIILSNPSAVTSDWTKLQYFPSDEVVPTAATVANTGGNYIGPFFLDQPACKKVLCSFIAEQGLYTDDGKTQLKKAVDLTVLLYPADEDGNATSSTPITTNITMVGSSVNRDTVAYTSTITLPVAGRQLIYARRVTAKDTAFTGSVVDTIKWEEVYALEPETKTNFGNLTTVMTKTYATGGALAIKERKFNCLVTRKIPYITGFTGTYPDLVPTYHADLQATNEGWQIFCALAIDPFFGNRQSSEIDFYNIASASNDVYNYFGEDPLVKEFSYTFDNSSISFEEAAQSIANTCFCVAYRSGSQIKWKPELGTNEPILIFNHRNKIPDSETRSVRFGAQSDYDSIQLDWVDPLDDSIQTFFIPEDQSGRAAKTIETIGIRNKTQATYHAWRSFYKMKYQNHVVEFDSTQEASILVSRDRVLVADNTRADTQDGEIWDQEVLQLTLSQNVKFVTGKTYTMFLQHTDGFVEAIPITAVPDNLAIVKTAFIRQDGGIRFPTVADAGLFSPGDIVTLVSTSYTDPVNGVLNFDNTYVVANVDGTTGIIHFENPGAVDAAWTLITEIEHSRTGINFNSSRDNKRKVNLAYAPIAALSLDPDNFARCTYVIRSNTESAPNLFMVTETSPKDNYTYKVSLANYDARFYYLDDLQFWMNFDGGLFTDASAQNHQPYISTAVGKATITFQASRGSPVYTNAGNSSAAWVKCDDLIAHSGSYTKAFWLQQGAGFDSYFLSNTYEQFRVNNTGRIIGTHNGTGGFTSQVGQVYRLHRTMFNRIPYIAGMNYSLKRVVATSIATLSTEFIALPEYTFVMDPLSNSAFVDKLYLNGLGRARDVGEVDILNALDATTITRAEACVLVSESAEAITHWASLITTLVTAMNASLTNVNWPSSDGNWHHACITYTHDPLSTNNATSIMRVYIDGVLKAQRTGVYLPYNGIVLQPVGLNSTGVASPYADDIRYWHRAFSEQEVASLYNATR